MPRDRSELESARARSSELVLRARRNAATSRELVKSSRSLIRSSFGRYFDLTQRTGPMPSSLWRGSRLIADRRHGLSIPAAVALSGMDHTQLWLSYLGLGGDLTRKQLTRFLAGEIPLSVHDMRILTHALNEHFWNQGFASLIDEP